MIIKKTTLSKDKYYSLESLNTASLNQLRHLLVHKTLGTSIIDSPMSPPSQIIKFHSKEVSHRFNNIVFGLVRLNKVLYRPPRC